jgi:hypothetical protein
MTDKPIPEDEKPDDAAFQRTLENMLRTPHKPHAKESTDGDKSRSAPAHPGGGDDAD